MHRILELIEKHSDITPAEIAVMLDMPETDVKNAIAQFEREGIIVGKKTVINWNKTDREYVTAFIELKVTPQQDKGFDQIAEAFYQYDQVRSVYLMSGAFDLALRPGGRYTADSGADRRKTGHDTPGSGGAGSGCFVETTK